MLALPLKSSSGGGKSGSTADVAELLQAHIEAEYSVEDGKAQAGTLERLQTLREAARAVDGATESEAAEGRDTLFEYYRVLTTLDSRVAVKEALGLKFRWTDSFKAAKSTTHGTAAWEASSVLFNVAALFTQEAVACASDGDSDSGLKQAANLFCSAAGVIEQLKLKAAPTPVTSDLSAEGLEFAGSITLAAAQECFFRKAEKGGMTPKILAMLAQGTSEAYSVAAGMLSEAPLKDTVSKSWAQRMLFATQYYSAEAAFRLSIDCKAKTEIGQELARLRDAQAALDQATKLAKSAEDMADRLDSLSQLVQMSLAEASKDNEQIYLQSVPRDLEAPKGKTMVKPTPFENVLPTSELSEEFLFVGLIPIEVHLAASDYSEQVDRLVKDQVGALAQQSDHTKAQLLSMDLPGALDAVEQKEVGLPARVAAKVSAVCAQGGLSQLREQAAALRAQQSENVAVLRECNDKIRLEASDDDELRRHFGAQWSRAPSGKLTEAMQMELSKYGDKLGSAQASDGIIDAKIRTSEQTFAEISQGVPAIEQQLPSHASANLSAEAISAARHLRTLLGELDSLLSAKEATHNELKSVKQGDDVLQALLELGSKGKFDTVFDVHLKKYDAIKARIKQNVTGQERLVAQISDVNRAFVAAKPSDAPAAERASVINRLETAADSFMELMANLQQGKEFYGKVQGVLHDCKGRVLAFCNARAGEKKSELDALALRQSQQQSRAAVQIAAQPAAMRTLSPAASFPGQYAAAAPPAYQAPPQYGAAAAPPPAYQAQAAPPQWQQQPPQSQAPPAYQPAMPTMGLGNPSFRASTQGAPPPY